MAEANCLPTEQAGEVLAQESQMSLMGMIWWWTVDFLPRPVVWPTWVQLAALKQALRWRRDSTKVSNGTIE